MAYARICDRPECQATNERPRHWHNLPELQDAGEGCYCGAARWILQTGAAMPSRLACANCGAGINLTESIRLLATEMVRPGRRRQ